MAGLERLVVFWTGWGIHFMVLVSFTVQVTLLLASDFRRRKDWPVLKVIIWSAYMLADTTAVFALGHMSVACRFPEHHLMALWAPLLLVHLGGQDNITAYAIEDNRLWLRHLQTLMLQVAAAVYVLFVSSILSHPMSSKVSWAAMLMFVVGVVKYGERIWALKRSNSCASSSLSATSYDKVLVSRTDADKLLEDLLLRRGYNMWSRVLAYSLLDVPKQMFEGPTSYVQISNVDMHCSARHMLRVGKLQLSMMYDLLYTKAAVVHTWYGLCSRVLISLPFTITALALFRSSSLAVYKRADVAVTNVLLNGAVVLEIMSVVRAIFSEWTAVLLYGYGWNTIGDLVFIVRLALDRLLNCARDVYRLARLMICTKSGRLSMMGQFSWIGRMGQHDLFVLMGHHYKYSVGRKMAKRMRVEDWWDSNVYSWSTVVPDHAIVKLLDLVLSTSTDDNITKSQGLNAVRRHMNHEQLADWIWTDEELKLEERILLWHIATHVYLKYISSDTWNVLPETKAAEALANYMFFLLAARPYMLPYPVTRQAYVQLCHDALTYFTEKSTLVEAILNQEEGLVNGTPLQLQPDDEGIGRRQGIGGGETSAAAPQPHQRRSMNTTTTLDRACQLAAKLIHITATSSPEEDQNESTMVKRSRKKQTPQTEERVDGNEDFVTGQTKKFSFSVNNGEVVLNKLEYEVVLNMILEVWLEMLCYTAYRCNENCHAKHLTNGGEFMTVITLFMIYVKNGIIH